MLLSKRIMGRTDGYLKGGIIDWRNYRTGDHLVIEIPDPARGTRFYQSDASIVEKMKDIDKELKGHRQNGEFLGRLATAISAQAAFNRHNLDDAFNPATRRGAEHALRTIHEALKERELGADHALVQAIQKERSHAAKPRHAALVPA